MRKRRILLCLGIGLVLILALAFAGAHFAVGLFDRSAPPEPQIEAATGAIYGYITAGRTRLLPGVPPLKNARISLAPGNFSTTSDTRGIYYLNWVTPGTYTVTISADGYQDQLIEKVRVLPGQALYLYGSLFPVPQGPATAALRLTTSMGIGRVPTEFPYNANVYLDAGKSKNASREGFRWEVYGPDGHLLKDSWSTDRPYTPQISEMPKASPYVFIFQPPGAGDYRVRLYLSNSRYPEESAAEVTVRAVNVPPRALPRVFPGPLPPRKGGAVIAPFSRGSSVVAEGEAVSLRGYALDRNYPTPELYNPGGTKPDEYGQNNDHYQRAFSWQWRLVHLQGNTEKDVTELLRDAEGNQSNSPQHVWFTAQEPGRYRAYLQTSDNDRYGPLRSREEAVEIRVLPRGNDFVEQAVCETCHGPSGRYPVGSVSFSGTVHGKNGAGCQDCHGPGKLHIEAKGTRKKRETISVTYDAALCGNCHEQYNEWEKSFHSDGYAFGFEEIARPLLLNCTKCHYPEGFVRTATAMEKQGISFKKVSYMKPLFPGGPLFFDFKKLPHPDGRSVSCATCHNPHGNVSTDNPTALRLGSAEALCATCHEEKWHHVLLRGKAGETGSAHEYPGRQYARTSPHETRKSCVLCHMDRSTELKDENGVRRVGGHTMRMRDRGPAEAIGGNGYHPDKIRTTQGQEEPENVLNLAPCASCHGPLETFNLYNVQQEIFHLWSTLGEALRQQNQGELPGYKPGDKCATCHRGGTLPFRHDPALTLEKAYSNYKLIGSDRSWGIHNPAYTRQLLQDALDSLK